MFLFLLSLSVYLSSNLQSLPHIAKATGQYLTAQYQSMVSLVLVQYSLRGYDTS
jgi:hypothetical protein